MTMERCNFCNEPTQRNGSYPSVEASRIIEKNYIDFFKFLVRLGLCFLHFSFVDDKRIDSEGKQDLTILVKMEATPEG